MPWVHKSRAQVAVVTKFCMMAPNIDGSSVWILLHAIPLGLRILRQLLYFFKMCTPLP